MIAATMKTADSTAIAINAGRSRSLLVFSAHQPNRTALAANIHDITFLPAAQAIVSSMVPVPEPGGSFNPHPSLISYFDGDASIGESDRLSIGVDGINEDGLSMTLFALRPGEQRITLDLIFSNFASVGWLGVWHTSDECCASVMGIAAAQPIPEPSAALVFTIGLGVVGIATKRRRLN